MKTYKVLVNWEVTGELLLKANSVQEAEERAQDYVDMGLVPIEYAAVEGCAHILQDVTEEVICDHKFIDSNNCAKCGVHVSGLLNREPAP